jgi:hypothetical protein
VAVIIINVRGRDMPGSLDPSFGTNADGLEVTIPVLMIDADAGQALKEAIIRNADTRVDVGRKWSVLWFKTCLFQPAT